MKGLRAQLHKFVEVDRPQHFSKNFVCPSPSLSGSVLHYLLALHLILNSVGSMDCPKIIIKGLSW